MGDRCWLRLNLHGNIDSKFTLVRVAKAILNENLMDEIGGVAGDPNEILPVLQHIADCISYDNAPDFIGHEVNYANIDDLENALQNLGVTYAVDHADGGSYGPGCYSWHPDRGRVEASTVQDGGVCLEVSTIRKALKDGGLEKLEGVLQSCEQANGEDLAAFTVSGSAERMLAKLQAVTALKVA